ncbi:MAG: DUF3881 family protein [Lachnospiraceae bacterium]|nr:DUF3881 family protein [Lachnospiraceae bacterium]
MHKYLRAVGFSKIKNREQLQIMIAKTIKNAEERSFTVYKEETLLAEYSMDFAPGLGLKVCGEMDEQDRFLYDYCIPYMRPTKISSKEKLSVERHMHEVSYAGICDDNRVGITIIFYLLNRIDYIKNYYDRSFDENNGTLSLSGLSIDGMIMMPIEKSQVLVESASDKSKKRNKLIEAAKKGDETAIETLTLDEMDLYSSLSRKIKRNDIYTLIETYFMPYGVECDLYSVMGEIESYELVTNTVTNEEVYKLSIVSNEIPLDVCINKEDLYGEPEVGRRFKGTVWLQGVINY